FKFHCRGAAPMTALSSKKLPIEIVPLKTFDISTSSRGLVLGICPLANIGTLDDVDVGPVACARASPGVRAKISPHAMAIHSWRFIRLSDLRNNDCVSWFQRDVLLQVLSLDHILVIERDSHTYATRHGSQHINLRFLGEILESARLRYCIQHGHRLAQLVRTR